MMIVLRYNELSHSGIKGMHWGVRRYQNKDGTLTNAGKKRYEKDARANNWEIGEDGIARSKNKKTLGEEQNADPNKWVKDDMQNAQKGLSTAGNSVKNISNTYKSMVKPKAQPHQRLDLSNMTDKELRDRINRELLERQYNDVFNKAPAPTLSKGQQFVGTVLEASGAALTVSASVVGLALGIKQLRGG